VDNNTFLAGYGIAQALPGPLFSFAAYLGAAKTGSPTGWLAGLLCVFAILLPPMLLVMGLLPLWNRLRTSAMDPRRDRRGTRWNLFVTTRANLKYIEVKIPTYGQTPFQPAEPKCPGMGKNVRLTRLLLSKAAHAALNPDLLQNNPVSGRGCSA
jgi:hypothetical protein